MAEEYNFSGLSPDQTTAVPNTITAPPLPSPASVGLVPPQTSSEGYDLSGLSVEDPQVAAQSSLDEKYGTLPQQALTGIEGAAQGVLGPLAPAAEIATGLTTGKDILARQTVNPWTHGLGEGVGFAGSAVFGDELGLAGVAGGVGETAAKLLPEVSGAKTAAELATLTASNEFSKMVEGDPNQTLGSAAINVGLSGLIGGIGGALIDKVNPVKYFAKQAMKTQGADLATTAAALGLATVGGAAISHMTGSYILGALGEIPLTMVLKPLVRPFIEKGLDTGAADAAAEYLYTASRGQKTLSNTIQELFQESSKPQTFKDLFPTQASRDKLEQSLQEAQNPSSAINLGAPVAHYLPNHATGIAQTTAQATNYFNQLKPTQSVMSPLDPVPPIDKQAQATYNRALDIAQQPLMVLQHVRDGSLQPQDMTTLRTLYPGLHDQMIKKVTEQLIQNKDSVQNLSYGQRNSLNTLIGGAPIDSTMSPQAAQAIINSASPQQPQQQQTKGGREPGKASGKELEQINKVSALYQTSLQARASDKRA